MNNPMVDSFVLLEIDVTLGDRCNHLTSFREGLSQDFMDGYINILRLFHVIS